MDERLEALEGMCKVSRARWLMLEKRRRKVLFAKDLDNSRKRRDLQNQIFAEIKEFRNYTRMRDAARAKTTSVPRNP